MGWAFTSYAFKEWLGSFPFLNPITRFSRVLPPKWRLSFRCSHWPLWIFGTTLHIFSRHGIFISMWGGIICTSKWSNADMMAYRDSCSFLHCSLFTAGHISKSNAPHCGTRPRAWGGVFYLWYLFLQSMVPRGILRATRQSPRNISEPSRCPRFQVSTNLWGCSPYKGTFRGEALLYPTLVTLFTYGQLQENRLLVSDPKALQYIFHTSGRLFHR